MRSRPGAVNVASFVEASLYSTTVAVCIDIVLTTDRQQNPFQAKDFSDALTASMAVNFKPAE